MKRMKFFQSVLFLFIAGLMSVSVSAQVTIGSDADPHDGAILDLSKASNFGFLLPRVALNDVAVWQLNGNSADGTGMVVYNTNNAVTGGSGSGVYVWNGTAWSPVKSTVTADVKVVGFNVAPANTEVTVYTGNSQTFTVSNFTPSTASYQGVSWTLSSPGGHAQIMAFNMTECTVKGLSAGDAVLNIVSLDGNVSKSVTIHVVDITVKSFTLPSALSIRANEQGTLTASSFIGSDDNPMSGVTVTWSTEDGTATAGTVTQGSNTTTISAGADAGNFKVKATAGGVTKECLVTVTVLNPGDYGTPDGTTYNPLMSGVICIDVRTGKPDPGTQPYVITDGSKTIKEVIWTITKSADVFTSNTVSGAGNTTQSLVFKSQAELLALATSADQTVTLNAYIEYLDGTKVQLSKTVKIQNMACCPGYLITNGAFTGTIPSSIGVLLDVDATLAQFSSATRQNLCVGPDLGANKSWNTVSEPNWCNTNVHLQNSDWDDGNNDWRLPNIAELANMQAIKGSIPNLATALLDGYQSSTDYSGDSSRTVGWAFNLGISGYTNKTASSSATYTRCVRTMD